MVMEREQDLPELNTGTLIGCVEQRGSAWHRRDDLGTGESNHYPGLIPVEHVSRRLFHWHPQEAGVAYLVPSTLEVGDDATTPVVWLNGQRFRVVPSQQKRIGVLRGDNDYDMGVFMSGAKHPPYQVTLIEGAERLVGTQLGISSAGCLMKGSRAWIEYSMPETLHDDKSGLDYRPNLLKADSMDGSISHTTALTINATVCMNTLTWNLLEASKAGRLVRRKHTTNFGNWNVQDERAALGILEQVDAEFVSELHALIEREVTPAQRIEVMDIIVPLPEKEGRGLTMAENKRDALMALSTDPAVEPWLGTAFGEFQRYNTYDHWGVTPKGTGRWERNAWRDLSGKRAEFDRQIVSAMEMVLT